MIQNDFLIKFFDFRAHDTAPTDDPLPLGEKKLTAV
jgi:hypothetical protein